MSKKIGKVGDIVEWDFKDETFDKYPSWLKDNVFTAEVAMVDLDEKHYGVYADYGQDFIPFDSGRIINNQ